MVTKTNTSTSGKKSCPVAAMQKQQERALVASSSPRSAKSSNQTSANFEQYQELGRRNEREEMVLEQRYRRYLFPCPHILCATAEDPVEVD